MAAGDPADDIVAAEARRTAAMLAGDAAALDALFDERLIFAHATGAVDDKAAYLAKMSAGRIAYLAIDWPERRVVALGTGAALLTGIMATHVRVDGIEKRLDNRVLTVWTLGDAGWRMTAFQSTPIRN